MTSAQVIDLGAVKHHSPHQGLHHLVLALSAASNMECTYLNMLLIQAPFKSHNAVPVIWGVWATGNTELISTKMYFKIWALQ